MQAVLGDARKQPGGRALFCGVAVAVALVFLRVGNVLELGATLGPPPPPAPCLLSAPTGFVLLDRVDNLESCGARLEAVYLENGVPVTGAYGGIQVFVDGRGVDAVFDHGPRQTLIPPQMRAYVDATLRELMAKRDEQPAMQVSVVRLPKG